MKVCFCWTDYQTVELFFPFPVTSEPFIYNRFGTPKPIKVSDKGKRAIYALFGIETVEYLKVNHYSIIVVFSLGKLSTAEKTELIRSCLTSKFKNITLKKIDEGQVIDLSFTLPSELLEPLKMRKGEVTIGSLAFVSVSMKPPFGDFVSKVYHLPGVVELYINGTRLSLSISPAFDSVAVRNKVLEIITDKFTKKKRGRRKKA